MSVLDVPATQYHKDQLGTEQPSLSASIAKILLAESPAHAKARHPRLSDFPIVTEDATHLDIGTCVHSLLLEGEHNVDPLDFPDWRTKAAREARDESRSYGRIPLLLHQWENAQTIADAAKVQLAKLDVRPRPFCNGKPEQTLTWNEGDVHCRARLDWLHFDQRHIFDLKTTSRSANPEGWSRSLFAMGYDIQAAFYLRGLQAVTQHEHRGAFVWVVVETTAPYAVSVMSLAPDALALADAKVEHAIKLWRECLASGVWPGYSGRIAYLEAPPWEETRWLERTAA